MHTSGEVMKRAREEGVAEANLEEFVHRFHTKSQYLAPEQAFQSCLLMEKKWTYGGYPGQIPAPATIGEPLK